MKAKCSLRARLTSLTGIVICAWAAILVCIFFRTQSSKIFIPIAFLAVVVLVAMRCGVSAGVIGSVVAAVIFAIFLYQPIGSVATANRTARSNLAWLVLGGLVCSYLLGATSGGQQRPD